MTWFNHLQVLLIRATFGHAVMTIDFDGERRIRRLYTYPDGKMRCRAHSGEWLFLRKNGSIQSYDVSYVVRWFHLT